MCSSIGMTVDELIDRLQELKRARGGLFNIHIETDSTIYPIERIELRDEFIVIVPVEEIKEQVQQFWEDPEGIDEV